MKIKSYRTIIFHVVLCGCETCCLTVEEHRLRVFENRVLRKVFGCRRGLEKNFKEDLFMTYTYHQMLFRLSNQGGWDGREHIARIWERGILQGFGWEIRRKVSTWKILA